jgi:hypothetical protein
MLNRQPVLEPADPQPGTVEIDLVTAQAMAKHHQIEKVSQLPMAPGLGGIGQGGDLAIAQTILGPLMGIRSRRQHTFHISPTKGRYHRHRSSADFRWRHDSTFYRVLVEEIAQQLASMVPPGFVTSLVGRTAEWHRAEIRALAGFREATVADAERLEDRLRDRVAAVGAVPDQLVALLERRGRELAIAPPAADRVDRIVRGAIRADDEQ